MRLGDIGRLMRPWQWYKNLIVLIPLVFSNNALNGPLYVPAAITFLAFCAMASGMYAWNDVIDRDADRNHPRNANRPVASGAISTGFAMGVGTILVVGGVLLLFLTNGPTVLMGLLYLILQVFYNAILKQHAVVDVIAIGMGFVFRAMAGTTAIGVGDPTEWLILCTFLFAVFLALAKRRHERLLFEDHAGSASPRAALGGYTVEYTERLTTLTAGLVLMAYFLYTFSHTDRWMMATIPFAVFGVFRYLLLIGRRDLITETELIFRDGPLLLAAGGWILTAILVLRGIPQDVMAWLEVVAP